MWFWADILHWLQESETLLTFMVALYEISVHELKPTDEELDTQEH